MCAECKVLGFLEALCLQDFPNITRNGNVNLTTIFNMMMVLHTILGMLNEARKVQFPVVVITPQSHQIRIFLIKHKHEGIYAAEGFVTHLHGFAVKRKAVDLMFLHGSIVPEGFAAVKSPMLLVVLVKDSFDLIHPMVQMVESRIDCIESKSHKCYNENDANDL